MDWVPGWPDLSATGRNALAGWLLTVLLAALAVRGFVTGAYRWSSVTVLALGVVLWPAVARRDPLAMPPWELLLLVAVPVVDAASPGTTVISPVATYVAVAAVALVVAVDVHTYTRVRMTDAFAVVVVVVATLAVAAVWNVAQWSADHLLGTSTLLGGRGQEAANAAMMWDFLAAAVAGVLAGVGFAAYLHVRTFEATARGAVPVAGGAGAGGPGARGPEAGRPDAGGNDQAAASGTASADADRNVDGRADGSGSEQGSPFAPHPTARETPAALSGRLDVSATAGRRVTWASRLLLAGLLAYGLLVRDVPTVTNAVLALFVTALPAYLERNHRLPLAPELVLWVTAAAVLHALGSAGLYDLLGQWDSLTHAVSASLVAATGYTVVRTVDLHSPRVYLPRRVLVVFVVLFILAVGVVWELTEFAIDAGARWLGVEAALAQHGIDDTAGDLLFNLAGALVAATLGAAYLGGLSETLAGRLDAE